ncbi:MAG: sugar ABC transporter permease [Clostridia bacterium]|nr:sugar ABC transporter permease [Clostridia bacterium]
MVISDKKTRIRKPRKNLRRNLFICTLLFVPLLHFLVFWLYINAKTISLAFMDWNYFKNAYEFVGLDNFREQFKQLKSARKL